MKICSESEPGLWQFVTVCGLNAPRFGELCYETELVRDLGIDGDDLLDCIEILRDRFDVDLSDFQWKCYMHDEAHFLDWPSAKRQDVKLRPITLKLIKEIINSKRWPICQ